MEKEKLNKYDSSNAKRFLEAFNNIDYFLKTRYNFNRAMGFSELIRKCVVLNYTIRKYEDDLIDYGRLRNAIIHNNNEDIVIAEPHISVVENIEHIEKVLTTPPKAIDTVARRDVLTISADKSMREVIKAIANSNYSNLPVYKGDVLIGVANGQKILDSFGKFLISGGKAEVFLSSVKIEDMLSKIENSNYYVVVPVNYTIEECLNEFNKNHKLLAILFTKNGERNQLPLGIMTGADVIRANKILEDY